MKTQKQNELQLSAEMEKQFDEEFHCGRVGCNCADGIGSIVAVKHFLATALEEQKSEILNEIESLLVDYFSTKAFSSTNPEVSINLKYVQNTIQKELRAKLAQMKGKE